MKEVTDPIEIVQAIYDVGGKCSELRINGYDIWCQEDCPFYENIIQNCHSFSYTERLRMADLYLKALLFDLI